MFSIARTFTPVLLAGAVLCAGCATGPTEYRKRALGPDEEQVVMSHPAELQPLYRKLFEEGRRNEVLNLMEIGVAAFHAGHHRTARAALDQAILNIESVYADNDAARRARSLWYEESEKEFKGEPYERSMAYYYRGLLYLMEGDYGNARASFRGGLLQDAFAEEEQHVTDFASLIFLAGWAAHLGGYHKLARQHFEEYRQYRPDGPVPGPGDNVLVIAETGTSPRKLADGVGHYELVYRRGKGFTEHAARVSGKGIEATLYPVEDIYFQASTRGGRTVDRIIEGQVKFKQSTENVGSALTSVSQNSALAGLAAGSGGAVAAGFNTITAIGVAAQGLSARSRTRADTRYWSSLPDALHVRTFKAGTRASAVTISYLDANGNVLTALRDEAPVHFDGKGNGLAFASARH